MSNTRIAGVALIVASILTVAVMMSHPTVHGRGADFVQAVADIRAMNAFAHGALVVLFGVLIYGNSIVAGHMGTDRPLVRIGMVAYGLGIAPLMGAAMTSGFVLPDYVSHYQGKAPPQLEMMFHVLRLLHSCVEVGSRFGVMAMSIAVACWSGALAMERKALGYVGLLAGGVPLIALAAGRLQMDVHGMLAFVCAQALWGIGAGARLVRDRP